MLAFCFGETRSRAAVSYLIGINTQTSAASTVPAAMPSPTANVHRRRNAKSSSIGLGLAERISGRIGALYGQGSDINEPWPLVDGTNAPLPFSPAGTCGSEWMSVDMPVSPQ